jgi:putative ABC transport system permease protein
MSIWHIAWSYLWNRKLTTFLTILSVALGISLISSVLTLRDETKKQFEEQSLAFDIVVGPKGSKLQLVLSSVYFMESPLGRLPYHVYEELREDPDVFAAFPIGLGDTYYEGDVGFRIVGTTRDFFDFVWIHPVTDEERRPFKVAEGRAFEKPMEAVIGATVARTTDLKLGTLFTGAHGFMKLPDSMQLEDHSDQFYEVVGVLDPSGTPNDRGIYVSLDSVWQVHGHEAEVAEDGHEGEEMEHAEEELTVSAVLVDLVSSGLRFQFEPRYNEETPYMAARPINEIRRLYSQLLEPVKQLLMGLGYLVTVIAAISILIGLYMSILQRKRDLAIMRALGASAMEITFSILVEALLVTLLGIGSGWVLSNGVVFGLSIYLQDVYGISVPAFGSPSWDEWRAFITVAFLGVIAGILPAWQAYATDVAEDLQQP